MKAIPEVRIYFADLLFFDESPWLAAGGKLESYEQYEEWTALYRKAWHEHEGEILPALQDVLGVSFYKSVIDVACAPYFIPKSFPLIMNFLNRPNQFVDVLTHELCHVLLTDNNKVQIHAEKPVTTIIDKWRSMYGEHDFNVLAHIPVHALSKYIYIDVLKEPARLDRDMESVKKYYRSQAYTQAWDYVQHHDYKMLIKGLKQMYEEVAS